MKVRLFVSAIAVPLFLVDVCNAQPVANNSANSAGGVTGFCPPAGMVVHGRSNRGEFVTTSKGSDPEDNTVCVRVTEGPSAGGMYGKPDRVLYGWYSVTTRVRTADTLQRIHEGLGAILSGKSDRVVFDMTSSLAGRSYMWTTTDTWTHTGQATLTIDGNAVNTITLHWTEKGGAGTNVDDEWDLWYDPIRHIWLKGELRSPGGPIRDAFEVTSVSLP